MDFAALKIKDYIEPKFLLIGAGGVLAVYFLLFGYVMAIGNSVVAEMEAHMPHKTVAIIAEEQIHADVVVQEEESVKPSSPSSSIGVSDSVHGDDHAVLHDAPPADVEEKYSAVQPIDGLSERTSVGVLPAIRKRDGLTPFDGYRRGFHIPEGMSGVALAFTDIGLSKSLSMQAIDTLPAGVSMIVSPYSDDLKSLQHSISARGHEMWMSVPVEDMHYPMSEPGPHGILSRSSYDYNREQLFWALSRVHGYAGVAMYTDHAFASARNIITSMVELVFERGLGYADLNSNSPYGIDVMAARLNGDYLKNPVAQRDVLLDEIVDVVESNAAVKKVSVIILPATPVNLTSVAEWVEGLESKGIVLVPLSAATGVAGDPPLSVVGDTKEHKGGY